ncbi:MAG: ABC transporter permease [Patescibacteria group bacterium]
MSKTLLILQREYLSRIANKWFWILTILIPLGFGLLMIVPILIQTNTSSGPFKIAFLDETGLIKNRLQNSTSLEFKQVEGDLEQLKSSYIEQGQEAIVYVPKELDLNNPQIKFLSDKSPGLTTTFNLTSQLNQAVTDVKLERQGISPETVKQTKANVNLQTTVLSDRGESAASSGFATALGYGAGIIIYITLLVYGSMVMQGVIEEKSNRIVEILISSVRPFELMLGKILGIIAVGFTQLLIWIVLTIGVSTLAGLLSLSKIDGVNSATQQVINSDVDFQNFINTTSTGLSGINLPQIMFFFIVYFLGGYLLYSSIFAAIGSLGENERDTQGLTLPVILPVVAGFLIMNASIDNPNGPLAVVGSMIPFTSPIVMMSRLPFGVPWWELTLSVLILIASFFGMIWVSGKIYRYGILRYGQKPTLSDFWKWAKQ